MVKRICKIGVDMKKTWIHLFGVFCVLLSPFFLSGCGEPEPYMGEAVYYLNSDTTRIEPEAYKIEAENQEDQLSELLEKLQEVPESASLQQAIPKDVRVNTFTVSEYRVKVDFSEEYYEMDATREVLTRAAVVRTLMQAEGVAFVSFTVNGEELVNEQGQLVGSMNLDSFVENPGQQINSSQETVLTLYFANEKGDRLQKETRVIHYSSNISLEKLVMEQLIEGPRKGDLKSTLAADTRLITVSVVDGVCYVNLDTSGAAKNTEVTEEVVLYSIVNSLTELAEVEKVQISVNGDTKGKLRFVYDLSNMYEKDLSYVEEM